MTTGPVDNENPVGSLISNTLDPTAQDDDDISGPKATTNEVLQCQFSSWYPTFSHVQGHGKRKNVTIPSVVLDNLPNEFEEYMLSDGVRLPLGATHLSSCAQMGDEDWSSDDEDDNNDQSDDDSQPPQQFHFPELNQQITEAIASFKGGVLPKLNWSAPKDTTWVNEGTLKCQTVGDVYLLLKSSDFCLHDVLRKAWKDCEDYDESRDPPKLQLILRDWCNLHPSMEFRCFVRQHELAAISQRNDTQNYPYLQQDLPRILEQLIDFFEDTIRHRFADGAIPNYVMDVYLDQKGRVWIVDFNLWARSTDSLLFEWSELLTLDIEDDPHVRLVETENQIRQDPLASYRAPIDTVDLASLTGGDASQFEEFMKQCQKPSQREVEGENQEANLRGKD